MSKQNLFRMIWRCCPGIVGATALICLTQASPAQTTVTSQLACRHLFMQIADGPHALSWKVRTMVFGGSGLTPVQITQVMQAGNSYQVSVTALDNAAALLHRNIKGKVVSPASGIQQFKALDEQRDEILNSAYSQLEAALGSDGTYLFEAFLNNKIKPAIVVGK